MSLDNRQKITVEEDSVKGLINKYIKYISRTKAEDEVYKWKLIKEYAGRPNTYANDFAKEVKEVKFENLIWGVAGSALNTLAQNRPEKLRFLFQNLFDESIDLTERVIAFSEGTLNLYHEFDVTKKSFQGEREMSVYLTYHNPEKYTFYKSSYYVKYCKLIGVKPAKTNEKYAHYLTLIDELIEKYIKNNTELIELVKSIIPEYYAGSNHKVLAQDILYQTLDNNKDIVSFEVIKDKFDDDVFNTYIKYLRNIVSRLNIGQNDDRVVFSVRTDRLSFTVGQRYCLNIFLNNPKGIYGVISKDKLLENSETYDGAQPVPYYSYFDDFNPSQKDLESIISAVKNELDHTTKSSFKKYNDESFENYVYQGISTIRSLDNMNYPLNTIFYGPPGTGKTYNTILRAAEIIENRRIDSFSKALEIYKENLHEQIEFITFHQNYSYEDFIQGLRPDTENDSNLTFERKDGIFKEIADKALKNINDSERSPIAKKSFEVAFNEYVSPLIEGDVEEIEVQMKRVSYYITAVTNKSIQFRKDSGGTAHTLSISTLKKMYEAESVLDIQGLSSYYKPLLRVLLSIGKDSSGKKQIVQKKNYVLIIDEINRANISRVFGELITLIEPDKRSHGAFPLKAKLPSGELFIIPSNLYIIGTMNTADKSIALLDIALRRRFDFEAMYPKYDIPNQEIYDVDILKKLNEKIIESKGHDFQIGHSYFMDKDMDLLQRMNKKVIPLLLEYFMNDEKEVRAILQSAGLIIEKGSWPIRIIGKNE